MYPSTSCIELSEVTDAFYTALTSGTRRSQIDATPFSMIDGALGDAYTVANLYHATQEERWWDAMLENIGRLVSILNNHRFDQEGLLGGLSGMALVMHQSRRAPHEFKSVLTGLNDRIVKLAERRLWALRSQVGARRSDYDYALGLAGTAHYLFLAGSDQELSCANRICNLFSEMSTSEFPDSFWTCAADLDEQIIENVPEANNGMRDMGFAHGICGVIATLRRGAEVLNERRFLCAAEKLCAVIVADIQAHHNSGLSYLQIPQLDSNSPAALDRARQAWCYGIPGAEVAVAGDAKLEDLLYSHVRESEDYIDPERGAFDEAGVCHGVPGRIYIAEQLGKEVPAIWESKLHAQVAAFLDSRTDEVDLSFWHGIGGTLSVAHGRRNLQGYSPVMQILGV